ncbi:MAG: hypothetical protein U0525_02670 [Patescibacteria group bacterium]
MEIKPVSDEPYNWLIYHFVADYLSGELTGNDEGEFLWMSKEEIINKKLFPSLKIVIDNVLDDGSKISYSTNYYDELENIIKTETYKPS